MTVHIIYWSGTGNTEAMAGLIEQGAAEAGATVVCKGLAQASPADIEGCDVLVLGCPSMGDEVLEEGDFEPFFASIEGALSGKRVALFGSYGWGDGQWMRDWAERAKAAGADLVDDGLIVNEAPTGGESDRCVAYGKALA